MKNFKLATTSNWPFAVKFGVPGLLALAVVLFVGIMASGTMDRLKGDLQDIVERKFNASILLASSVERLRAANGALYQLQTKQAAGLKPNVNDEAKKITDVLDQAIANLETFKKEYASPADAEKIDNALKNLKTYKDGVGFVASMLDVDFKSTVSFLAPLADTYDQMIADLTAISTKFLGDSRAQSNQAVESVAAAKGLLYSVSIPVLLLTVLVTLFIAVTTIHSVQSVARTTRQLADGDTNVDIHGLVRGDELGKVVEALAIFRDNIEKVKALEAEQKNREQEAAAERKKALYEMANDFEQSVGQIVGSVASASTELHASAESLSDYADQTNRQSVNVAEATSQASISVQTVAAAAEELAASINEITRQVNESTRMSAVAVDQVKRTDTTVSTLSSAATEIGDVINLIKGIAQQTNLLALNATIEAARAGEAGKGFAVVASEVKSLANQTARATEEITHKIDTIQSVSVEAVNAIRAIGETIGQTSAVAKTISSAIQQQAAATHEISKNVQQTSTCTSAVTDSIMNVTQAAKESQGSASQVLGASADLSKQAERLRSQIDAFLTKVRAD